MTSRLSRLPPKAKEKAKMRAKHVAIALEIAKEKFGKSQAQVARDIGVQRQAVSNWKSDGLIDIDNIDGFCLSCGVSIHWFMTGEGDPEGRDGLENLSDQDLFDYLRRKPEGWLFRMLREVTQDPEGSNGPE